MAALQPIKYKHYSHRVFEKKPYMECTTLPIDSCRGARASLPESDSLRQWDASRGAPTLKVGYTLRLQIAILSPRSR